MITRGEDVEASALRQRGWSMSAIAAVPRCCGPAPLGEMLGRELGVGDGPASWRSRATLAAESMAVRLEAITAAGGFVKTCGNAFQRVS